MDFPHESKDCSRLIEGPAPAHGEALQLWLGVRQLIGENSQAEKGVALQFMRNVEPVLAQSPLAGGKSGNQTNFHYFSGLKAPRFDEVQGLDVGFETRIEGT
jgi:hypothetical protein